MENKLFSFAALNTNFVFDLPEGLWAEGNFIKTPEALDRYVDDVNTNRHGLRTSVVIPVIAFGIVNIDKEAHPDAVSDRSAWIATADEIINVPEHQLPIIEGLLKNEDAIEACQNGLMGIQLEEYDCKYGRRVKIIFCDR